MSRLSVKESTMKAHLPLVALGLAGACGTALATEYGTVVSSTPITAQVAVPQQQCQDVQQVVPQRTSGGGALLGAIIGAAVGHNVGGGMGQAAATGLGMVTGAAIGDRVEANGTPPALATVRSCQNGTAYENRIVGYDVVYEYQGQRYSAQLAQDPGRHIPLDVNVAPAGALAQAPVAATAPVYAQGSVYAPAPVYSYGAYGGYGYAPLVVSPRLVIGGAWHGGRRDGWRDCDHGGEREGWRR
jgi:uncharacterized protein YcfJ